MNTYKITIGFIWANEFKTIDSIVTAKNLPTAIEQGMRQVGYQYGLGNNVSFVNSVMLAR